MIRSTRFIAATLATAVLPGIALAQASPGANGTFLIKGGTVVTGTGERLANTDILVRNGRVAQLGELKSMPEAGVSRANPQVGSFIRK